MPQQVNCADISKKLTMAFSLPRVTWTANIFGAMQLAKQLNLAFEYSTSAFWSRGLEQSMRRALESGFEYVLTIDNDTVLEVENVLYLYALMKSHPEMDAVAALQMKRDSVSPLMAFRAADGTIPETMELRQSMPEIVKVAQAHFGLTIISLAALQMIPRPWFLRLPDSANPGESVDDDIYFWRQWEKAGKSLYVACHNPVGHLEEFVTWPGANLDPVPQNWGDYEKNGKPGLARAVAGRVVGMKPIKEPLIPTVKDIEPGSMDIKVVADRNRASVQEMMAEKKAGELVA